MAAPMTAWGPRASLPCWRTLQAAEASPWQERCFPEDPAGPWGPGHPANHAVLAFRTQPPCSATPSPACGPVSTLSASLHAGEVCPLGAWRKDVRRCLCSSSPFLAGSKLRAGKSLRPELARQPWCRGAFALESGTPHLVPPFQVCPFRASGGLGAVARPVLLGLARDCSKVFPSFPLAFPGSARESGTLL